MQALVEWKNVLEAISYVIVIASIPTAIISYYVTNKKEREAIEYGTFDSLDDKFIEFQLLCLEKPYLNIFDVEDEHPAVLTPEQKKEELIAYSVLFAIFERAYVMYKARGFRKSESQWKGWVEVMHVYAQRGNYREAWTLNGFGWDTNFEVFMNRLIQENEPIFLEKEKRRQAS